MRVALFNFEAILEILGQVHNFLAAISAGEWLMFAAEIAVAAGVRMPN
jgi:hypothetical protein